MKKDGWLEMSYNRYFDNGEMKYASNVDKTDKYNFFRMRMIDNFLEDKEFEEDDYSENSFA